MIIKKPNLVFMPSLACYKTFQSQYNQTRENKAEQLRRPHQELFAELLRQYRRQLSNYRKLFNDTPDQLLINPDTPTLSTNRMRLSRALNCHHSSIYRQLNRLIESGAIETKIGHGTQRNFELILNPNLVLINDVDNPEIATTSIYLAESYATAESHLQNTLSAKSTPVHVNRNTISNIISTVETVNNEPQEQKNEVSTLRDEKQEHELITNTKEQFKNTGKQAKTIRKSASKLEILKARYVSWFYLLVMDNLFAGRPEIYPAELRKAKQQIATKYFEHCKQPAHFRAAAWEFEQRVLSARRYLENHPETAAKFDKFSYPSAWLDPQNPNGFAGTKKWFNEQQKRSITRKRQAKFHDLIAQFAHNPSLTKFNQGLALVKSKLPEYTNEYLKYFTE